jgi:hypothetical protein
VKTFIEVRFQIKGKHCWPDAPTEVAFLRSPHRHTFHFRVRLAVCHLNRAVEFIMFRDMCRQAFGAQQDTTVDFGTKSCEQLAVALQCFLTRQHDVYGAAVKEIGVSEDGEFEGIVQW